jgi:hypothetical protein
MIQHDFFGGTMGFNLHAEQSEFEHSTKMEFNNPTW